jgi:hypothetical protein
MLAVASPGYDIGEHRANAKKHHHQALPLTSFPAGEICSVLVRAEFAN